MDIDLMGLLLAFWLNVLAGAFILGVLSGFDLLKKNLGMCVLTLREIYGKLPAIS